MAHIAFRTMISGWSLEQAEHEVASHFGLVRVNQGPDYRHMERFFQERVIPYRIAQQKAADEKAAKMASGNPQGVSR
jgi:hypothetical protein